MVFNGDRVVGLITEYNPFHKGHEWHLQEAKRLTNAKYCIVVMSGNFVQRGAPAVLDKYARAKMALMGGADLVLELPVCWALGSAEYFASGAVALLDALGVVDDLCFGSECGDIRVLSEAARILEEEPEDYRVFLKEHLKNGKTFPLARAEAFSDYLQTLPDPSFFDETLLKEPNNILGMEYLKAIRRLSSKIHPVTIPRMGGSYHSEDPDEIFTSATALRNLLSASLVDDNLKKKLAQELPASSYEILTEELGRSCPIFQDSLSLPLHYQLLSFSSPEELAIYQDVSQELADRIFRLIPSYENFSQFVQLVKTKQYTESRIRRCLLHILLSLQTEQVQLFKERGWNGYLRVLGFRKKSSALLKNIKELSRLPLITKLADAKDQLSENEMAMLKKDIYASHVYESLVTNAVSHNSYNEYKRPLVIL